MLTGFNCNSKRAQRDWIIGILRRVIFITLDTRRRWRLWIVMEINNIHALPQVLVMQ